MITLTDDESEYLKKVFNGITDGELIRELVRRGRFGQVRASVMIDHALKTAPGYIDHMKRQLGVMVGVALSKETERGYVVTEHHNPYDYRQRTIRIADVILLRAAEGGKSWR